MQVDYNKRYNADSGEWRGVSAGLFAAGLTKIMAGLAMAGSGGAGWWCPSQGRSRRSAGRWPACRRRDRDGAAGKALILDGLATIALSKALGGGGSAPKEESTDATKAAEDGIKLTGGGRKVLRDPALQAMKDKTLREGILTRGGGGGVVRKAGDLADRKIGEIANAAAEGNEASVDAIKLLKEASRLGNKNHGQ